MFIYSKTNCHFCNFRLTTDLNLGGKKVCSKCLLHKDIIYSYDYLIDQIAIQFQKIEFIFWNLGHHDNRMTVIDHSFDDFGGTRYNFPIHLEVNEQNYLQVFERVKNLNIFR